VGIVAIVLLVIFVAGVAIWLYARYAARRVDPERAPARTGLVANTTWASGAGDDFAGLSESARCDLVFAVAALDDERSNSLLHHALDDPAEPVATAAAHALASSGRLTAVETYLESHPGARADRIAQVLALLDPKEGSWPPPL